MVWSGPGDVGAQLLPRRRLIGQLRLELLDLLELLPGLLDRLGDGARVDPASSGRWRG